MSPIVSRIEITLCSVCINEIHRSTILVSRPIGANRPESGYELVLRNEDILFRKKEVAVNISKVVPLPVLL